MRLFCFGFVLLLVPGCEPGPAPYAQPRETREVHGEPGFFCDWNRPEALFYHAAADHAAGNRRTAAAWALLDSTEPFGADPKEQGMCWTGALYYLGAIASRDALPGLIRLAARDPVLEAEVTDPSEMRGTSDLGQYRGVSTRQVFLALAMQVRRQLDFDGQLDADASHALRVVEDCALHTNRCVSGTAMHIYAREDQRRTAVRALAVAGTWSSATTLHFLRTNLSSLHFLMPHAVGAADRMQRSLDGSVYWLRWMVPPP